MYIEKLTLKNFKCFENVEISFSKITLLTGPNSSGKSSILYGLLGTLQSDKFPYFLSPNGKYVNMGDYKEMVFRNNKLKNIGINIVMGEPKDEEKYKYVTEWTAEKRTMMPKLNRSESTSRFGRIEISKVKKSDFYRLNLSYDPKMLYKGQPKESIKVFKSIYYALDQLREEFRKKGKKVRKTKIDKINIMKPLNIKGRKVSNLDSFLEKYGPIERTVSLLHFIERDINFISSFRIQPERTYFQKSLHKEKIGINGDNYIQQIIEWEKHKDPQFQELKSNLKKLNLLFSLKPQKLTGGRFELRVKVKKGDIWSLLTDVGFGLSQLLPILVADLQLANSSTLFVAQPEIHLHPSAQASLADYFTNQAINKTKRYILETHSEYLINRFRLAIVQGKLKETDVSVYYLDNTIKGNKTCKLEFKKDGQIKGAPRQFFDTYMMDVTNIALNS